MRVTWLVTGGCGFLGANLCDAVLARREPLAIIDNLTRTGAEANLEWLRRRHGDEWRFFRCDVRDRERTAEVVGEVRPSVVVHLAAQVAATKSLENPQDDFDINAGGTLHLLEAVRRHCPEARFIFASSNKVYGALEQLRTEEHKTRFVLVDHPNGLAEDLALDGHTPYGCSKLAGDQYVRDYGRVYGMPTIVLRHSSMYGGRQFATYDQGWVGWFCSKALEMRSPGAQEFTIAGTGKQVRDLLHVSDVVELYLRAAERAVGLAGRVYNIGGGPANSLSLLELFSVLEESVGVSMRFRRLEPRLGDQKVFVADTSAARSDLDWYPKMSAAEGVQLMLDWCLGAGGAA